MQKEYVVRGHVSDSRHIELDEPLPGLSGTVEVVVRVTTDENPEKKMDVLEFIRTLPPGTRSKEDIDRQIQEERDSWEDVDLVDLLEKLGPGSRTKEDIDRQLQDDRDSPRER